MNDKIWLVIEGTTEINTNEYDDEIYTHEYEIVSAFLSKEEAEYYISKMDKYFNGSTRWFYTEQGWCFDLCQYTFYKFHLKEVNLNSSADAKIKLFEWNEQFH